MYCLSHSSIFAGVYTSVVILTLQYSPNYNSEIPPNQPFLYFFILFNPLP